jgi:hypothetical protein
MGRLTASLETFFYYFSGTSVTLHVMEVCLTPEREKQLHLEPTFVASLVDIFVISTYHAAHVAHLKRDFWDELT